ncbi:MAG: D-alanine--D-alanine ligase [Candidatus Omnitrophica bacterium]|nr:D-alanine--D-alanine ligase [Candidatus Omnitrophota bacterium]
MTPASFLPGEGRIGVLCGGVSSERDISLKSGRAVHDALVGAGFKARLIDAREDYMSTILETPVDYVFVALHGRMGEDGTVQRVLETAGIPYSGPGAEACRISMDKALSRRRFEEVGLGNPRWAEFDDPAKALAHRLSYPVFVKPVCGGSSIGTAMVSGADGMPDAVRDAFAEDERILIEERIAGREMAVGILGDSALSPIEIRPKRAFYDFEAKYGDSGTEYLFPDDLEAAWIQELKCAALLAYQALGLSGFSRIDMILAQDRIYLLEANAIPGLTPKSLLPKQAARAGFGFAELCVKIMQSSLRSRPINTPRGPQMM